MKKAVLIADSGGSKTDWCLNDEMGNKTFFTTDSYHPHLLNEEWIHEKKKFWIPYTKEYDLDIHFFGAGCSNDKNKIALKSAFNKWGIGKVSVESDLLGASKACFGNHNGVIGILGTGSVIAEIKSNSIHRIYGGHGYLLGDEGSGYFYGKILIQRFIKGMFSAETNAEIENKLGDKTKILSEVYGMKGKKYVSDLSALFSKSSNSEITEIHSHNIQLFIDAYLPQNVSDKRISFVGSYAFHSVEILKEKLAKKGWELGVVIKNPIQELSENIMGSTF